MEPYSTYGQLTGGTYGNVLHPAVQVSMLEKKHAPFTLTHQQLFRVIKLPNARQQRLRQR